MRRILIVGAVAGVGFLILRVIAPKLKLHERLMARCEAMFERMPDECPPKRMMRGIDETQATTARILDLLEAPKKAPREAEFSPASSTEP
jgi:hypothetical protein